MKVTTFHVGGLFTNCYLVTDEKSGISAVVDPGAYSAQLRQAISALGEGKLEYILLTHAHFDHILGAKEIKETTGAKIAVHKNDEDMLTSGDKSMSSFYGVGSDQLPSADVILNDGDTVKVGDMSFRVMHTPGHTTGSVCYIGDDVIFSGDTLFAGTCGRCDFPGGSLPQMLASLKKLSELEGDYKVYPGHDTDTTLDYERKNNEYMSMAVK
ncbi:MAG: MBL fold metallo-hydrolase [Clostridia bacterium]|nr:MBL fold metallo-hydrolase [Oscillospiraceae bacterium]MBQ6797549.1 MBL fold metallo-hydrolase [Clostridia bacterium]